MQIKYKKEIRFHKSQLIKILQIGIPAGLQGTVFSLSNVVIQSAINSFGSVVMAANAAAMSIEGFVFVAMWPQLSLLRMPHLQTYVNL